MLMIGLLGSFAASAMIWDSCIFLNLMIVCLFACGYIESNIYENVHIYQHNKPFIKPLLYLIYHYDDIL